MDKLSWINYVLFLLGGLHVILCESETITVTRSKCGGTYSLSAKEKLYLHFFGDPLPSECMFQVSAGVSRRVCSESEKFDVDCGTKLEYYQNGYSSSYEPDKWYGCEDKQKSDYCAGTSKTLHLVFKNNATNTTSSEIKLELSTKKDDSEYVADASAALVYVIIGIIIAVIVVAILTTAFCIFMFCRRRRQSHAGSVYRTTQPTVATTSTSETSL